MQAQRARVPEPGMDASVAGSAGFHNGTRRGTLSAHPPHGATTIRASKGGGAGKWLIGAVVAAGLVGGGYYAWKTYAPAASEQSETAFNDHYAEEPARAGPLEDEQGTTTEAASTDEATVQSETPTPARRATNAARTQPTQTAEVVPEETIGITPINATTTADESDVVITAHRPIWTHRPTARRLSALYPERALERGREGEASLHCIVQDGGALGCETVSATPGGFSNAAQRVARTYRHSTQLSDGSSAIGSPVNLRVIFRIDDRQHG